MVGRDEWFAIHASGPAETALSRTPGAATATGDGGFMVDREAVPAVRSGFETAIQEMLLARRVAADIGQMQGEGVNPVVDKYMTALIGCAVGEEGSFTLAAGSAITAYQSVVDQLDAAMAGYGDSDDEKPYQSS